MSAIMSTSTVFVDGGSSDGHVEDPIVDESKTPFNCAFRNLDGSVGAKVVGDVCEGTGNQVKIALNRCCESCEHRIG